MLLNVVKEGKQTELDSVVRALRLFDALMQTWECVGAFGREGKLE